MFRLIHRGLASATFAQLEKDMWQKGAGMYANTFGAVTSQAANELLDAARVPKSRRKAIEAVYAQAAVPAPPPEAVLDSLPAEPPFTVVDVATGNGGMASAAAARGVSKVVGVDSSQAMVDVAKSVAEAYPGVASFSVADAEKLPFEDNSVDAVLMGFLLLHLPDPAKALAEAHRVLKPGGRVAYSVWQAPPDAIGFQVVLDAIATHGNPKVELPGAPLPFFHFADAGNAADALIAAGFDKASIERTVVPCAASLPDENVRDRPPPRLSSGL